MTAERGTCGECGTDGIRLTPRGLLFKHPTPAGDTCTGGGGEPVTEVAGAQPAPDTEDDWPDDDEDPAPLPVEQSEAKQPRPLAPAGAASGVYEWLLTIRQPALYLDDDAWHQANAIVAGQAAMQAGHTPKSEATCTGTVSTEDCSGLVLTYTVPIEGGPRG